MLQAELGESYGSIAPTALIIADGEAPGREAAEAAKLAGCNVRAVRFADASTDLSNYDGLGLVLIECAEVPDGLLDLVLARADTMARERSLGIVAVVLPEQIDVAAAQLLGPRAQLLCAPTMGERVGAITSAKWLRRAVMEDVNAEAEAARLRRLGEEVARIADTLARLTRGEAEQRGGVRDAASSFRGQEPEPSAETSAAEVRSVIRARRMRAQFFAGELFADPAWDMLLDLFAAGLEQRRVSVSSLCIAAAVPPTTALRWITTLNEAGLFERQADPADRRRAYIGLSAKGFEGMRSYASALKRAGLQLV
jgi:hypothetical protein